MRGTLALGLLLYKKVVRENLSEKVTLERRSEGKWNQPFDPWEQMQREGSHAQACFFQRRDWGEEREGRGEAWGSERPGFYSGRFWSLWRLSRATPGSTRGPISVGPWAEGLQVARVEAGRPVRRRLNSLEES